jgi:hypothetical protein
MTRSFDAVWKIGAVRKIGTAVAVCIGCSAALPQKIEALPAPSFRDVAPEAQDCGAEIAAPSDPAPGCSESSDAADDRTYLVETATPGFTMVQQGPDVAIGRLHPEFVRRLAGAIRDARAVGLSSAGIFSAYRPPAFGVGGFSDKFNSLHTYGLAVDMTGIGGPGSLEAKTWYEIAAWHGVVCPYGVESRVEWNHCQPTWIKIIRTNNPLRETVRADGPVSLENMFVAGSAIIDSPPDHAIIEDRVASAAPARHESPRGECRDAPRSGCVSGHVGATVHPHAVAVAHVEPARARCEGEARSHAKGCAASRGSQVAERRTTHSRQSADRGARESHRV